MVDTVTLDIVTLGTVMLGVGSAPLLLAVATNALKSVAVTELGSVTAFLALENIESASAEAVA